MIIIGIKENILELIKKHEGLTYNGIKKFYNEEYPEPFNTKTGYKFLERLRNDDLIISVSEAKKEGKGKEYTYKPTAKAFIVKQNEEDKLTSITRRLVMKENISEEEERWLVEKCQL